MDEVQDLHRTQVKLPDTVMVMILTSWLRSLTDPDYGSKNKTKHRETGNQILCPVLKSHV